MLLCCSLTYTLPNMGINHGDRGCKKDNITFENV